jgi:hypothetical protein
MTSRDAKLDMNSMGSPMSIAYYYKIISMYTILGMSNSQFINNATINGAQPLTSPAQLNPGSSGVDFIQPNGSIILPFVTGVTPIVAEVSVPNTETNVNQIRVVITASNGTTIVDQVSPSGTNKVKTFPLEPLPENCTMTITFDTTNGNPPENVTISVIACYTPSTTTTIVTSGSIPPSVTGSTPTLTISSTTSGVTSGTGEIISYM